LEGAAINYYKRHLGDYARKTRHLSILEHGVYNLILDAYYDRERPLSETEAIRFSGARTDEELRAVKNVLSEFFIEENGVFSQTHADEHIAEFHKRQKTNRKLGAIGGKRNAKRIASKSLSEIEANDKPSHKPLAISHKERSKEGEGAASPLPVWLPENVWADWHSFRNSRKGWTAKARELSLRTLTDLHERGFDPRAVVNQSIERGWTGLFPIRNGDSINANRESPAERVARINAEAERSAAGSGYAQDLAADG
jgi:uncharacterized protein YdaU (DUF1376 family)